MFDSLCSQTLPQRSQGFWIAIGMVIDNLAVAVARGIGLGGFVGLPAQRGTN